MEFSFLSIADNHGGGDKDKEPEDKKKGKKEYPDCKALYDILKLQKKICVKPDDKDSKSLYDYVKGKR